MKSFLISVRGIVQGVGFRPFVYKLASDMGLKGSVRNTSDGVIIEIEGEATDLFIHSLQSRHPSLAKIDKIEITEIPSTGHKDFTIIESGDTGSFTLVPPDISICNDCKKELFDPSDRRYLYPFINCTNCGPRFTITKKTPYDRPNTTMSEFNMCPLCLAEYNDPLDRRFHAQPNACPECGPTLQLRITDYELVINEKDPLKETIKLLQQGAIVAVKGIGGFHLCCDASNEKAVRRLRENKRKSNKPFALMSPDVRTIRRFCEVSEDEQLLLEDTRRPIVLLKKKSAVSSQKSEVKTEKSTNSSLITHHSLLPFGIAPNNKYLGFMLPYTPLHYLLFFYPFAPDFSLVTSHFSSLVMTSANLAEEPIVISNDEAISKLSGIADAFLLHNREIFMRADDSVVKTSDALCVKSNEISKSAGTVPDLPTVGGLTTDERSDVVESGLSPCRETHHSSLITHNLFFVRRSRGYVPGPVLLDEDGPDVLGCGADIKNTFTITKGIYAIPSQHIGDMENVETLRFFEESLGNLKHVYRSTPVAIGHDLHPGYLSTRWAIQQAQQSEILNDSKAPTRNSKLKLFGIQHHHAHVASVMAEHGLKGKVTGIALDGTGYGTDGNIWGGEFLICSPSGFSRFAHFRYIPLPGGEMAVKECWRTAISFLASCFNADERNYGLIMKSLDSIGFIERYGRERIDSILKLIFQGQFSPLSSGAGRLFDAVSALTGVCDKNTYEGEAAIALENAIQDMGTTDAYKYDILDTITDSPIDHSGDSPIHPFTHSPLIIDFRKTGLAILDDLQKGKEKGLISLSFHNTIINVIRDVAGRIRDKHGIKTAALSGGVFQNEYLLKGTFKRLVSDGFDVFTNEKVPCNDAGISLGQAYILRSKLQ